MFYPPNTIVGAGNILLGTRNMSSQRDDNGAVGFVCDREC